MIKFKENKGRRVKPWLINKKNIKNWAVKISGRIATLPSGPKQKKYYWKGAENMLAVPMTNARLRQRKLNLVLRISGYRGTTGILKFTP